MMMISGEIYFTTTTTESRGLRSTVRIRSPVAVWSAVAPTRAELRGG